MRDLLIGGLIQAALIFGYVASFYLIFGLSIIGILSYRLHKEERDVL